MLIIKEPTCKTCGKPASPDNPLRKASASFDWHHEVCGAEVDCMA